jgi:hypothetical protein
VIKAIKEEFPHPGFPVKIIHKDGKDLKDTKTCFFQCEAHAKKYIERSNLKKKDYKILTKGENVND